MEANELLLELREEFLNLFTEKEDIVNNRRDSTYIKYINLIGKDEYDVFNLEIELKAIKLKVKLAQAYINKGQRPDFQVIENRISELWKEYEAQLKRLADGVRMSSQAIRINQAELDDAKDLYKMLVKRLHPDLHPDLPEELRDMLTVVKAAYKMHDVTALRQLAIKYQLLVPAENLDDTETDPDSLIPILKEHIEQLRRDIEELISSFPLNLAEKLKDDEWVMERQIELKEKRERIEVEIEKQEKVYSLITDCYGK